MKNIIKNNNFKHSFISSPEKIYDIIIIDSCEDRIKYLKELVPFLSPNGFFVLDDSERYKIDIPNIKEITFFGLKKESFVENETKILFFNSEFLNA